MSQPENPSEIQPERLPFDVELYKRAEEFCNAALAAVPELHGVAIVPLWNGPMTDAPPGMVRLRNPQPPYLPSLMQLLKRMAAFNVEVHRDLVNQLQMYDRYAAELAQQIKARQDELAATQETNPSNA